MMKSGGEHLRHYGAAVLAGTGGGVLLLICLAGLELEPVAGWIKAHVELAAWVQAFGSIAAVIGAAWIAGAQGRADAFRRTEEQRQATDIRRFETNESLTMLTDLATHAAEVVNGTADELERAPENVAATVHVYPVVLRGLKADLDQLLTLQSAAEPVRRAVFNVRGALGAGINALEGTSTTLDLGLAVTHDDALAVAEALRRIAHLLNLSCEEARAMQRGLIAKAQAERKSSHRP